MAKAGGIVIWMGENSQRPTLLQEDGRGELATSFSALKLQDPRSQVSLLKS